MTDFVKDGTSDPRALVRVGWVSLGTGLLWAALIATRLDPLAGLGFAGALVWALANFGVLGAILRAVSDPDGPHKKQLAILVPLKLFGLYGAGIWVLMQGWFSLEAVAAGFTWPLVVLLFRALSHWLVSRLRADAPVETLAPTGEDGVRGRP